MTRARANACVAASLVLGLGAVFFLRLSAPEQSSGVADSLAGSQVRATVQALGGLRAEEPQAGQGRLAPPSSSARPILSESEFAARIEETKAAIPSVSVLRSLSAEEAHHMPVVLRHAAVALGGLAQALHDNPALAPQALDFYGSCAREESYPTSVRALCYSHLRDAEPGNVAGGGAGIPDEVRKLAANIPAPAQG